MKLSDNLDENGQRARDFISSQLHAVFSAVCDYATEGKVVQTTLFGDLILRVARFVEKDVDAAICKAHGVGG